MIIELDNISVTKVYSRIISLVPSQTELLFDLGLGSKVVGITKFCVHPQKWRQNKVKVGGTKNVKIDVINDLAPDLIIANKEENDKQQIEKLAKHFHVLVTDVKNLEGAIFMINQLGILVGKAKEAIHISKAIKKKFEELHHNMSKNKKTKVAYLIWKNPYMTIGGDTFINNMLEHCGFENIFSKERRYPVIILENFKNNCELILLPSEPYPFKKKHLKEFESKITSAKAILVDGEMFSWYGSRLLKAADYFIELRKKFN